ncbi:hypothetical protein [Pseudochryseolinea flava]|uniref:Lipoprotein n=1 Tax=Pseudochryseolinea flava TaxID=2059302 RepID=A0A364Y592_9BACT|nr:hypothetical protein [Pseudochryseolinea flava]RAW01241.1 hypothetical protein DQQ10_10030 [Pseudochryseolinea flava]
MQRKIVIVSLVLLFFSCVTTKKVSSYDEAVKFYRDVISEEKRFCPKKINNDYWIKELGDLRLAAMRNYLDSVGTKTADNYLEFEERFKAMTLRSASIPQPITIDYENIITDLRLTNNMRFSKFVNCDSVSGGHVSLPIFNEDHSKAVIETEGGTLLFEKINERWKFKDRGLLRVF